MTGQSPRPPTFRDARLGVKNSYELLALVMKFEWMGQTCVGEALSLSISRFWWVVLKLPSLDDGPLEPLHPDRDTEEHG